MIDVIVFPTELAMRRFQQERALQHGFVDASGHITFARLRSLCIPYAKIKGSRMSAAQQLLMRNQVVEVARGHFAGQGTLGAVSDSALCDVLDQLIKEMASLPFEAARVIDWLLDQPRNQKLYQLGTLFSVWRAILKQEGFADALDVNQALLRLLQGSREKWPPLLRDAKRIVFRSVRWFNPFEESCVSALNQKMKLSVETALPPAHADAAADRLDQRICAEIMAHPWSLWAEDLGDALAVNDAALLQLEHIEHTGFSRSSGAYGEIEDLARRIGWYLQHGETSSERIALVVPNVSTVQDIIPHVFSRFRIPYFFRRGRPVLSSPCVKAFLAWLAFPVRPERDVLIDLVRNPAICFDDRESAADCLLKMPPLLRSSDAALLGISALYGLGRLSGDEAAEMLRQRIAAPEDHFNAEAVDAVSATLQSLGSHTVPLNELIDLVEELLENATVRPRNSHEQGVWIINPFDAAGLEFDIVLFAGLNEGEFPAVPQQDALLNDTERHWLRQHLEAQGRRLPALALPQADVLFEQQSVLLLTVLGMARSQLILSYQSVDPDGNEKSESEYYRRLWMLTGWGGRESINVSSYDEWRIQQVGAESMFARHLAAQQDTVPEDRVPMPGESFLTIVPLSLCRAEDEALQAAVQGRLEACDTGIVPTKASGLPSVQHLVEMLKVEAERDRFLETPIDERVPSIYCGHIPVLKEKVAAWLESKQEISPTALESLARCRYVFLLEKVFGLRDERMADDTPDPMERGGLVHAILREVYRVIAEGVGDAPRLWAVPGADGWRRRTEDGVGALPLAVLLPEMEAEYVELARTIAGSRMDAVALGHPGVWAAEREKVMEQVLNFVRYDAQTCAGENRYPAQFELTFGGDRAVDLGGLRLKGVIDRVDLIFSDTGELERVRVLDYKGGSRALTHHEDYLDEIRRNLDCQLPVYALAAQNGFFGECNTDLVNARTEAGYLFYERKLSDVASKLKKSLIPMGEEGLLDDFVKTLQENVARLKFGDFAVDPLIASYSDYESVCRVSAVNPE